MADKPRRRDSVITRGLALVSVVAMFAMMAVTFVDVLGRYLINMPIYGAAEAISILMGLAIFAAFPLVTRDQTHIVVTLFENLFKGRIGYAQRLFVLAGSLGMFALISYLMLDEAVLMHESGARTFTFALPRAPIGYAIAAACALATYFTLAALVRHLRGTGSRPQ